MDGKYSSGGFEIDVSQFAKDAGMLLRLTKELQPAIANLLNELGFAWRNHVVDFLRQGVIVRSPGFLKSRMFVEKTSPGEIDHMATRVGSTLTRGKQGKVTFDGLSSLMGIEHGGRTRTLALLARGGDKAARARSSGKLMPGSDFPTTDDFPVVTGSRVQALIRHMRETAPNKTFIIKAGYGFQPGLYRIKRGQSAVLSTGREAAKIQVVQHFDRSPKPRHHWMWLPESMKDVLRRAPIAMMWQSAVERVLKAKR